MINRHRLPAVFALLIFIVGCSSGGDIATLPDGSSQRDSSNAEGHMLWGLYQFTADPNTGKLEYTALREAVMHLNALQFLEPPPFVNLTLETLEFNGNIIDADIGLKHPFLGLNEFTGFDVCGILISKGSVSGFTDADLRLPGQNDLHLVNPDGHSRWWNPAEFPVNNGTMFSYKDGLLGTPDAVANYSATLNGYKYFCDGLNPDDPLTTVNQGNRGVFRAGQKNVRHYTIDMGTAGMVFNYAIDANWQFPTGQKPWQVPGDFGPEANRPEAWFIDVTVDNNTLWNDGVDSGGDLELTIDAYDWYNADSNTLTIESPGNFTVIMDAAPTGVSGIVATFDVDIESATPAEDSIDVLITVECEAVSYGGLLPGKTQAAYLVYTAAVADEYNPCADFTITSVDPSSAEAGEFYLDFTVYGTNFQDGANLAIDVMDGDTVLVSGTNVGFVDATEINCDMDFDGVDPGDYDLRVTNGCEPVSYKSVAYSVTGGGCDDFEITSVDPPIAESGQAYPDFTVYGSGFQDGANLAIDLMDGTTLIISGTSVTFVDATEINCDMDFAGVDTGIYQLRVTNGCEPVSQKSISYTVTEEPTGGDNYNPRPGVMIYDLGICENTSVVTVMFNDMEIYKYQNNYSQSAETGLHASMVRRLDSLTNDHHPLGSFSGMNPVLAHLNWGPGVTLCGIIADGENYVIDVTETNAVEMDGRCYLWKHWTDGDIRSVYAKHSCGDSFGPDVALVPDIGSGAGNVNRNAVVAMHMSRDNDDPAYACWVYALESSPEYEIERYDVDVNSSPHTLTWDKTICDGTQGNGAYQLNNPKDISGDSEDRIYILDALTTGDVVVKIYDADGAYLGMLQNSSVITGAPYRLDIDESNGEVHIAHANGIAVFTADDMPWS